MEPLYNDKEAIIEELENWIHEQICWKFDDQKWSANQVIEHFVNSKFETFQYLMKKTSSRLDGLESETDKHRESKKNSMHQWLRINNGTPAVLPQPQGVKEIELWIHHWRELVHKLRERLEQVPKNTEEKLLTKHPLSGRLNLEQTMNLLIEHIVHHGHQLRHIQEKW